VRIRVGVVAAFICVAVPARAQLVPNDAWRTIPTKHFRIHFTPPLEDLARRAAVNAERAYTELSGELVPPRGTIDLVVADNVDYVNGYATPFPSNRIVVYAHPPTDASGLRFYEDWNALVITHELTHIFHLDRTRGIWRIGQAIFGRNPLLFPGAYEPSWVTEGLAVYFESRLTGVGRLESSEHSMIARAAALEHALPTLQELSPSTSRFPGGEVVYVYGSLMFDYLSRTRGPGTIRAFVERGAKSIVPFILTPTSRGAFGESFQTAWVKWRDSLTREMQTRREVMPDWRQLTSSGRIALFPRWFGDTALVYSGDKGREVPAAYAVTLGAREQRLGRRNGTSPNVRLSDGSILFSQPEFMGPYRVREDLYVERSGTQTRLTHGARLTSPDARANGDIVAIQDVGGTTRVVRVSRDGRTISPLTASSLDTQYSDPRWSPDGNRIAAISQTRGTSQIVVLDPSGALITSFGATRGVNSTPSWSRDGTRVFFSSDRDGLPQIYMATLAAPLRIARLTDAPTGVFSPELSPAQTQLASVLFKADGYHIGVAPLALQPKAAEASDVRTSPRVGCVNCVAIPSGLAPLGTRDTTPAKKYSPWLSLLPRYWVPVLESSTVDGTTWGAATSGEDIVGRHNYTLEAAHNNRLAENSAWLWYRYAGFGLPVLDLYVSQNYSNSPIEFVSPTDTTFGYFAERQRIASLQATFLRPRFRTYSLVSFGGEIENLSYATSPSTFFSALPAFYQRGRDYPALIASAGFSNASRPSLSISPEDGISISVSGRQRWQTGTSGASTRSVVGVSSLYKSLDLPGFAHHVLAFRAAGGWADERSPNLFHAGGVSGNSLEVFPGYAVGEQRRTFGVRGYPVSAESGIRSYSAAVEYRVPLFAPSRGFRFIPVFIDKASLTLFGESGRAYCPSASVGGGVCSATSTAPADNPVMTSAGAELNLDTSIQLDLPTRLRLGVAFPLANREILGAKSAAVYATFGASF
jgi:hypothetical protein